MYQSEDASVYYFNVSYAKKNNWHLTITQNRSNMKMANANIHMGDDY